MKKVLYILSAAALLATGCQKQEVDPIDYSETNNLTVNALIEGVPVAQTLQAQSRAASVDVDLKTYGFYLAGYHTVGLIETTAADAYPNVFSKDINDHQAPVPLVTCTDEKFTLKTIKWMLDDATYLSFFGWGQAKEIPTTGITSSTTGIFKQTQDDSDKGYPWIDIRNADAPADQTDIVGSRSLNHKNDAVVSAVDLDFRHLLSKITFKAKSTSGATVDITAANVKYAANKVYKMARYTFDSDPTTIGTYGSFAEYHSGTEALGVTYPSITDGNEALLGSALLLPQALADGDISLELKYKISPNGGDVYGPEKTTTLPLAAITFEQGNNYLYDIDIQATELFLPSHPIVTNWDLVPNTSPPLVVGPKDGETLLLLDGYDKPYTHTDGKKYWLDRSGYNRHVELTAGFVSYDEANHGYNFKKGNPGGTVPSMGPDLSSITCNVVAECSTDTYPQTIFQFGSFTLIAPNDATTSTWTNPAGHNQITVSQPVAAKQSLWSVIFGGMKSLVYQDTRLRLDKSVADMYGSVSSNILAADYDGRISYVRVTNRVRSATEIEANFAECESRFNIIPVPLPPSDIDYTTTPANSYIAYPDGGKMLDMKFDATKKPRSTNGLGHPGYLSGTETSNYYTGGVYTSGAMSGKALTEDLNKADIAKIEVVWQTLIDHGKGIDDGVKEFTSYDANTAGKAFIKDISYDASTGYCTVSLNGTGNALIAAYDAAGTILWSWHIWGTDAEPKATIDPGNDANGAGKKFMDRNLGALSSTATQPTEDNAYKYFGLTYQWGRKEPFTGAGPQYTSKPSTDVNSIPTAIFDNSGTYMTGQGTKPINKTTGGYTYSGTSAASTYTLLSNPTTHYNGPNTGIIITDNPNTWTSYNSTTVAKSIYDPCPYGYRVPINGSWFGFTRAGWTNYAIIGGTSWKSNWWPAAGYRHGTDAILYNIGNRGYYWSSSPYSVAYSAYNLYFNYNNVVNPSDNYYRSYSFSIRCIEE